jgi:hypothetical protein
VGQILSFVFEVALFAHPLFGVLGSTSLQVDKVDFIPTDPRSNTSRGFVFSASLIQIGCIVLCVLGETFRNLFDERILDR